MSDLFRAGELDPSVFAAQVRPLLSELVGVRVASRARLLTSLHLLLALGRCVPKACESTLLPAMLHGARPLEVLRELASNLAQVAPEGAEVPLTLERGAFSDDALALLEKVAREYPASRADGPVDFAQIARWTCAHLASSDRRLLAFSVRFEALTDGPPETAEAAAQVSVFTDSGALDPRVFTPSAPALLQAALEIAARTGNASALPAHLLLACLDSSVDELRRVFLVHGNPVRVPAARAHLIEHVTRGRALDSLAPTRTSFSSTLQVFLQLAGRRRVPVDESALLWAILHRLDLDAPLRAQLVNGPLQLDVVRAIEQLERAGAASVAPADAASAPPGLEGCEVLGASLAHVPVARYVDRAERSELGRALFSPSARCVVVYGEPGVGARALVEAFALRASRGEHPHLARIPFVRIDAGKLSDAALRGLLRGGLRQALVASRAVIVIESPERLLELEPAALGQLTALRGAGRLVVVCTTAAYKRLPGADPALASALWPVPVAEADHATAARVLEAVAPELERELSVRIPREILPDVVRWADAYPDAARRPGRGVRLLRSACEEAAYAALEHPSASAVVDLGALARFLSRRTGIREDRVLTRDSEEFYAGELSRRVFGQPHAIARVARGLAVARGAARAKQRPAGVFLFVGPTGTGKTLLAREIAALYSPRAGFRQFAMGDYKEAHSVARLVGAPPGYVGHAEGGGLVEALLVDPASVLLFDEAEKAHPDVWDVLLQLLSEGWVEDASRRVARADDALIVLTSNLGTDELDRCMRMGLSREAAVEEVQRAVRNARDPRTGVPRFRPEFFGRIDDIAVFFRLDEEATLQIATTEIEAAVAATSSQIGLSLEPAGGSWRALAELLCTESRGSAKEGRAIAQALRNLVLAPLAVVERDSGRGSTVRVAIDDLPGGGKSVRLERVPEDREKARRP